MNYPYYKDLRTGTEYHPKYHVFSDGAILVDCSSVPDNIDVLQVVIPYNMPVNMFAAILPHFLDAKSVSFNYCELYLPYLPYARADRRFERNQNFGLKVFVDIILIKLLIALECKNLVVNDVHNEGALRTILDQDWLNITVIPQLDGLLQYGIPDIPTYVVAPDKGAVKKAKEIARWYEVPLIEADKVRDVSTGRIIEMKLLNTVPDTGVALIVDDICDGGGTFLGLADLLPENHKKMLYVTHGIFSKGKDELLTKYDSVHALFDWSKK